MPRRVLLLALALPALGAPLFAARASAWGFFGHVAIADRAAAQLNLTSEERDFFVLGSLMGDLDKSDHLQGSFGGGVWGQVLGFLARFPRGYMFPPLVDQHAPDYAAELLERADATGDARLRAWALGVMIHGLSDRFTDGYPDPSYRVSVKDAEVSVDMKVFHASHQGYLRAIERADQIVFGARPSVPWTWWFFGTWSALKRGRDRDRDVLGADPFAQLILDTHRALHGASGPRNASDVCRQQIAMDAFTWNYRLKARFMPGWREFARHKGDAWYREVDLKVDQELVPLCVQTVTAWQDYLARRAAGQPATRPAIP